MTLPSKHKWISLTILAILIPTSLLTAFKLTGIIPEPTTIAETVTTETITWNMNRPSVHTAVDQWSENSFSGDAASVCLIVHIYEYSENEQGPPSWGNDYVKLGIAVTANVDNGFVHSVTARLSEIDSQAFMDIDENPSSMQLSDLAINTIWDVGTIKDEAYAKAFGVNHPYNCSLSIVARWIFVDENSVSHSITVTSEVTYFNGTAYRKVVIPIMLEVLID